MGYHWKQEHDQSARATLFRFKSVPEIVLRESPNLSELAICFSFPVLQLRCLCCYCVRTVTPKGILKYRTDEIVLCFFKPGIGQDMCLLTIWLLCMRGTLKACQLTHHGHKKRSRQICSSNKPLSNKTAEPITVLSQSQTLSSTSSARQCPTYTQCSNGMTKAATGSTSL